MNKLMASLASLGLTLALQAVTFGDPLYHIEGTEIYPASLPNDFHIHVDVVGAAVIGGPNNFLNGGIWGAPSVAFTGPDFTANWAGPPFPAQVGLPSTFGFDFTSNNPNFAVTEAWWTINGLQVTANLADDFTVSGPEPSGVPEPSTVVLAGLGLLGLGFVALRKKFRRA